MGKLHANPKNPRTITDARLEQLKKSLNEFGDISGIVFNRLSGQLVTGHQRNKDFDKTSKLIITKKFEKPTRTGTIAIGYILHKGERFSYREVEWTRHKEMAANIAANKNAGDWDLAQLKEDFAELSSFDVNFDLDLTMFEDFELAKFTTVSEHQRELIESVVDSTQHLVIIECKDEKQVEEVYEEMNGRGYTCKIM